jgi:hypothetical protein
MNSILSKNAATEYTFCPHCGVDVTIFSHEDDCPCVRHNNRHQTATARSLDIDSLIEIARN